MTDTAEAAASAAPTPARRNERHYDLLTREGSLLEHLTMNKDGITLDDEGLAWHCADERHSGAFADIAGIRLEMGILQGMGNLYTCRIEFRDGTPLFITSVIGSGEKAGDRDATYRDFVRDLHRRIPPAIRATIDFHAGNSAGRQMFGMVTLVVATLFFIVMPIVLLLITREPSMVWALMVGGGLVFPLYRVLGRNTPRTYDPSRIPPELMP